MLSLKILLPLSILLCVTTDTPVSAQTLFTSQEASVRWDHARELLGKRFRMSVISSVQNVPAMDDFLLNWVNHSLKTSWKLKSRLISDTIIQESQKYHFDPFFLVALIQNESSFNPEAIGTSGEIGLMQVIPQTGKWIAQKYEIPWKSDRALRNPVTNIRIGSAYISYLREKFEFRSQLYISAYNMGSANVQRALDRQIIPKEYANKVMSLYVGYYAKLKEEMDRRLNSRPMSSET